MIGLIVALAVAAILVAVLGLKVRQLNSVLKSEWDSYEKRGESIRAGVIRELTKASLEMFETWKNAEVSSIQHSERLLADQRAVEELARWREAEIEGIREQERTAALAGAENALVEWRQKEETAIRADAINRSQAISKGKITEHLVPFFPEFPYSPRDCRFLGSPVDLLVFNGLSEGELKEVVFLEIKTGGSQLTARERQIRTKIQEGLVRWEELRV